MIQWERNYTTTGIVRFSEASTAFDVLGMGVMSTGVSGASVTTLVMAGWECWMVQSQWWEGYVHQKWVVTMARYVLTTVPGE